MRSIFVIFIALSTVSRAQTNDSTVIRELLRLEAVWNTSHVIGDTIALKQLWADDLTVIVPQMKPMSKDDALAFWRSGAFTINVYETDSVQIQLVDADHAAATGTLRRVRNMMGKTIAESWRFRKYYIFRYQRWLVVRWQDETK